VDLPGLRRVGGEDRPPGLRQGVEEEDRRRGGRRFAPGAEQLLELLQAGAEGLAPLAVARFAWRVRAQRPDRRQILVTRPDPEKRLAATARLWR
jgi:hypothetical protein